MLALINSLNEVSGKAIIWCQFREDVVRVHRRLNALDMGDAVHYYGGTTKRERPIHEGRFRNDPKCRWLVGQYQAGGQGLDFSAASDIFWYSHTTDLLRRRQADERATKVGGRRIGVTDLVAVGSNDEKMLMNLDSKEVTADYLTGYGLRDYLQLIR
jgi:SNF2 family DNA or RNA helicase